MTIFEQLLDAIARMRAVGATPVKIAITPTMLEQISNDPLVLAHVRFEYKGDERIMLIGDTKIVIDLRPEK